MLERFLDHIELHYGEGALVSVSQSDFTREILTYMWYRGYKVTALEQEDYDDN